MALAAAGTALAGGLGYAMADDLGGDEGIVSNAVDTIGSVVTGIGGGIASAISGGSGGIFGRKRR